VLTSTVAGFAASLVLIVAIGAQNAFVLRQGLRREHVLPVVVTCAVSDLMLIAAGIAGLGAVVTARPTAVTVIRSGPRSCSLTPRWPRSGRGGPAR
jgi:L-lysine exporter family protein LysE/ArgO